MTQYLSDEFKGQRGAMLRRPTAGETEQDLLDFEERFLASGERPSVSLAGDGVRSKRKQPLGERDVVQLGAVSEIPTSKRSKFKQRKQVSSVKNLHVAMNEYTTELLEDIHERDVIDGPVTMPTRITKHGFPTVHKLDWKTVTGAPSHPHTITHSHPPNKKKSLFAQHYDNHSPELFGFEFKPTNETTPTDRDKVQPFSLTVHTPPPTDVRCEATPTTSEGVQFASTASQAWTHLLTSPPITPSPVPPSLSTPSLISGEGLVSMGVSEESAREEVSKIHSENVQRLVSASREELLAERERVEQTLGAELVAFLKRRTGQRKMVTEGGGGGEVGMGRGGCVREGRVGEGDGEVEMGGDEGVRRGSGGDVEMGGSEDVTGGSGREVGRGDTGAVVPSGWLHMDTVEKEKMEWMSDILPETQEGGPVRFSLEGLVIPRGTALPSHIGLHHHGEKPQAAGYTLQELLGLVRSAVLQQRVLSLTTLAKIMRRAWCGEYRGILSHCVLSALCDAGLPLMLRYAVDDSSTPVIAAALASLHSLLVPQWEELLLQEMCDCHLGTSLPCTGLPRLTPQRRDKEWGRKEDGGEGEEEEEDADIMARDTVQGYLVTGLLHRLRYILEVVQPGLTEVTLALEVLTRISRHSLQSASEVVHCPRLMATLFRDFLPLVWEPVKEGDTVGVYGVPQPAAVRLIQVICSSSRNLTSLLLSHHQLLEVVVRYTLPHPSELALSPQHAHSLARTALQAGREALQYGLAADWLRDCYPLLSKHFFSLPSLSLSSLPLHEATHLACLIWLLEPAVSLPPSFLPPPLTSSLLPPLLASLPGWIGEGGGGEGVLERLVCVRAVLHVLASHLSTHPSAKSETQSVVETAAALSSPSGLLVTLAGSTLLSTALQGLRETSPLCQRSTSSPPPPSLPSLHSLPPHTPPAIYGVASDDNLHGFLKPHLVYMSSVDLLLGYLRLCLAASSAYKGGVPSGGKLLDDQLFQQYVLCVCEAPPVKYSCLAFGEFQLLYITIKLFMMKAARGGVSDADRLLYHRLALHLLSLLPPGMECAVDDLIAHVAFHPDMFPELGAPPGSLLDQDLSSLSLHHPPQPLSPTLSSGPTPLSFVLATTHDRLPSISSSLLSSLQSSIYSEERLESSMHLFLPRSHTSSLPSLSSLRLPPYPSPLLPADWSTLPLVTLYQRSLSSRSCDLGSEVIVTVKDSLHVQLLLEQFRPSCLAHLPPSTRLARTLITFLIGNDLFLEKEIRPYLSALLCLFSSPGMQKEMDLTLPIPGLASFHEFYQSLLAQFSAVSYGDPLFSCFVLLPLQRHFPVSLRRTVWDQYSHTLRLLSLPLDQLPVKLDSFLLPLETDHQLLDLYMGALATESVRPQWSPVLYLTAIHHVHHFLFPDAQTAPSPFQKKLLLAVQHMQQQDTQTHILHYSGPSLDSRLGFKLNIENIRE